MYHDCSDIHLMTITEAQAIIALLTQRGIVTDEDGTFLGSTRIEHCVEQIEQQLRTLGYQGGPLSIIAKFYSNQGAIYAIYDEDTHGLYSARDYLDLWVQKNVSASNP